VPSTDTVPEIGRRSLSDVQPKTTSSAQDHPRARGHPKISLPGERASAEFSLSIVKTDRIH